MWCMNSWLKAKKAMPLVWMITGTVAFALAWQMMAQVYGPLLVATPAETLESAVRLFTSPPAVAAFSRTFGRVLLALGLQIIAGLAVGMLAGFYPWVEDLLKPAISILVAVPPVALALFVIFVFGGGERQVVAAAVALGFPLLYGGAVTAVRSVDRGLLEMLRVFRVPKATQLLAAYVPATLYSLLPSILLAAGLTVRLLIMAEVIVGVDRGIGQALSQARVHMATAEIFAWMLVMAATVLLIEGVMLYLVKSHVLAWQARR
ncbi:MAG: putative aliphatic sulfonates transport permease protein SsuC [Firmicutes bacterium]|nr:putative aliphatic sulfonates transport permease protein SsuC [candidate division NPL-UPA2 bacterium]